MLQSFSLLLLAVLPLSHAAPTPEHHVIHERRDFLSPSWMKRDRLSGERYLPMRIGLTQSELENAEEHLMSVSHPDSPNYGNHWDREKVIEMFRPSQESESQVRQWLADHGIDAERIFHSNDKAWFMIHAMVEEAESLLTTEFHEYEFLDTGDMIPSCEQYHLPKHISPHIDFITPGIHLPAPGNARRQVEKFTSPRRQTLHQRDEVKAAPSDSKSDLSHCDTEITPACITALYGIPAASGSPHPNNSMGIYETGLQFYVQSDLDTFFTNYTTIPNGTHPIDANIDGGQASSEDIYYAGAEASIDIQLAFPIIYPQVVTDYMVEDFIYQSGFAPPLDAFFGFDNLWNALDASYCNFTAYNQTDNSPSDPIYPDPYGGWQGELECGTKTATNVISISWGINEVDMFLSYQKRECLEFLKLGLQGVSILVASGDSGAANFPADYASGTPGCLGANENIFNPQYPGNCPWVTSVGATRLYPGQTVADPESAMARPGYPGHPTNASSGGGFSNIYPIPDYQKSAVASYYESYDPGYPYYSRLALETNNITKTLDPDFLAGNTGGKYNRLGRGSPDISAVGYAGAFFIGGSYEKYLGTSLSAPIFGAIITRMNEARLNAGKKSLGFLNPSLYANPSMLKDITNGTNFGCSGIEVGFTAVPGWDPVTGLGTPNFTLMMDYYMSLP